MFYICPLEMFDNVWVFPISLLIIDYQEWVLKLPFIIIGLPIFPCNLVRFCFICFEAVNRATQLYLLYLSMYWPFYHYETSVLVSSKSLVLKAILSGIYYSHSCSLMVIVCMVCLFLAFFFQPICVFEFKVCLSYTKDMWVLLFLSRLTISAFCLVCLDFHIECNYWYGGFTFAVCYLFSTSTVFFLFYCLFLCVKYFLLYYFESSINFILLFLVVAVKITIYILYITIYFRLILTQFQWNAETLLHQSFIPSALLLSYICYICIYYQPNSTVY